MYWVYSGLYTKLHLRQEQREAGGENGLVLSLQAKREAYMQEHFPNVKIEKIKPKKTRTVAERHGFFAGSEIEIRPGVAAAPKRQGLGQSPKLLGSGRAGEQLGLL
jgi:hypothetical protein